jgi:hypothetical protein
MRLLGYTNAQLGRGCEVDPCRFRTWRRFRSCGHRKLQLDENTGVLFGPQWNEGFRIQLSRAARRAWQAAQTVKRALVDARLPMMHMQAVPCPAGLAGAAVAIQDLLAQAGEALAGVSRGAVAGAAEVRDKREIAAQGQNKGRRGARELCSVRRILWMGGSVERKPGLR